MGTQLETLGDTCCTPRSMSLLKAEEIDTRQTKAAAKDIQSSQGTSQHDQNETVASTNMLTVIQPGGSTYTGEIRNDMKHGYGVLVWEDGSKHEGAWQCDMANGYGRLDSADGNVYEGMWFNDQAHGEGKLIRADGGVYEGYWVHDKQHGEGTETWPDGTQF